VPAAYGAISDILLAGNQSVSALQNLLASAMTGCLPRIHPLQIQLRKFRSEPFRK